jgi:hypothetical protein
MHNKIRHGRKRLSMDLPLDIHNQLKMMSIKHQCSITALVLRALVKKLDVEAKREGHIEG